MAIQVASNFMLNSKNFLDARGGFKTIASMKAFPESGIPDGLITYVAPPVDKYYKFLSTNSNDPVTGKWREYKGGSSGGNTGAIGESWTTNIECGGIAANTSIDSDMTVVEFLKGYDDFAVLVCPDHPTPLNIKTHSSNPVPFLIYNSKDEKNSGVDVFTEANAKKTGEYIEKGFTMMNYFLSK